MASRSSRDSEPASSSAWSRLVHRRGSRSRGPTRPATGPEWITAELGIGLAACCRRRGPPGGSKARSRREPLGVEAGRVRARRPQRLGLADLLRRQRRDAQRVAQLLARCATPGRTAPFWVPTSTSEVTVSPLGHLHHPQIEADRVPWMGRKEPTTTRSAPSASCSRWRSAGPRLPGSRNASDRVVCATVSPRITRILPPAASSVVSISAKARLAASASRRSARGS